MVFVLVQADPLSDSTQTSSHVSGTRNAFIVDSVALRLEKQ
jgi:hypothetical protein